MYSIQNWIYGVPITSVFEKKAAELGIMLEDLERENEYTEEERDFPLTTRYSGAGDGCCGYIGVELGETDECGTTVKIDGDKVTYFEGRTSRSFTVTPTAEQMAEAQRRIDLLPKELAAVLMPIGVYIVFSTS